MTGDHAQLVADIQRELRAIAPDPVDASPIITTDRVFYGAPVGELRKLARRLAKQCAGDGRAELVALADALWATAIREEMVVAAIFMGHHRESLPTAPVRMLDRWGALLDTWEITDQLGMSFVGPWVADDIGARFGLLYTLSRRRNPWLQRLALVGCHSVLRYGHECEQFEDVGAIVLRLADQREAAIPKAISWVLRTGVVRCPGRVRTFIGEHEDDLPAIALRETRKKLEDGEEDVTLRRTWSCG